MNTNERLYGSDFVRICCAIGIICFHYSSHSACERKILYTFANGGWGNVLVSVFFALSGGMLFYNYGEIKSLKIYLYKRWKSIFPPFYVAFAYFYIRQVCDSGTYFYGGSAKKILLSLIGMDGYFAYKSPNYYLIGEWFLGAIIMMYIVYPFLLWCIKHIEIQFACIMSVLLVWVVYYNCFEIHPARNLITCIFSFYIGMVIFKHIKYINNKWVIISSVFTFLIFFFVPINIDNIILERIFSFAIIILLYNLGRKISCKIIFKNIIKEISKISYSIFLLQHMIIGDVLSFRNYNDYGHSFIYLIISIGLTMVFAKILTIVSDYIISSNIYIKIEKFILKN